AAMSTRSKRFSTFSMQSSTVTRATNVSNNLRNEGWPYTMQRAMTSLHAARIPRPALRAISKYAKSGARIKSGHELTRPHHAPLQIQRQQYRIKAVHWSV